MADIMLYMVNILHFRSFFKAEAAQAILAGSSEYEWVIACSPLLPHLQQTAPHLKFGIDELPWGDFVFPVLSLFLKKYRIEKVMLQWRDPHLAPKIEWLNQEGCSWLLHIKVQDIPQLKDWHSSVPFELYCESLDPHDYHTLKNLVPQATILCNAHEEFEWASNPIEGVVWEPVPVSPLVPVPLAFLVTPSPVLPTSSDNSTVVSPEVSPTTPKTRKPRLSKASQEKEPSLTKRTKKASPKETEETSKSPSADLPQATLPSKEKSTASYEAGEAATLILEDVSQEKSAEDTLEKIKPPQTSKSQNKSPDLNVWDVNRSHLDSY